MDNDVKSHIHTCWNRGMSISKTVASVQRRHNLTLTFEDVRSRFAKLVHLYR